MLRSNQRSAVTLVELLVVLLVMGLLAAITLPAIQYAREAARRQACVFHLRQFGIAIQGFHDQHKRIPAGSAMGFSTHVQLLPQFERENIHSQFDFGKYPYEAANAELARFGLAVFRCPSEPNQWPTATSYAGNHGTGHPSGQNGVFVYSDPLHRIRLRLSDIKDGLSQTVAMSEVASTSSGMVRRTFPRLLGPDQFGQFIGLCTATSTQDGDNPMGAPWIQGSLSITQYNHVLPPNGHSCYNGGNVDTGAYSATSHHASGVNVLYADAHVSYVRDEIDNRAWVSFGSRDGSEIVP